MAADPHPSLKGLLSAATNGPLAQSKTTTNELTKAAVAAKLINP